MGFARNPEGVLIRSLYRGDAGGREVKLGGLFWCADPCVVLWLIKASLHPLCVAAGMWSMRGGNKTAVIVKRLKGTVKPVKNLHPVCFHHISYRECWYYFIKNSNGTTWLWFCLQTPKLVILFFSHQGFFEHAFCIKPLSSVSLNMSEQMNVSGDISKLLSRCFSLRPCCEELDDCAVFCLPLFSCLPVDVCVISGECCKRRNEKGVAHTEHKTHTELWDVNCLTVYCLLLYISPEESLRLLTATAMCFQWYVSIIFSLTSSTLLTYLVGQPCCTTKLCSKPQDFIWERKVMMHETSRIVPFSGIVQPCQTCGLSSGCLMQCKHLI